LGRTDGEAETLVSPPRWCLPVTFVGPARVGAVRSFVRYLQQYAGIGVLSCSMSVIDHVTFMHVKITSEASNSNDLGVIARELNGIYTKDESGAIYAKVEDGEMAPGPRDILPAVLKSVGETAGDIPNDIKYDLAERQRNFHVLLGPPNDRVNVEKAMARRALWASWEVEGSEMDLGVPFRHLYEVLSELVNRLHIQEPPNVEYLICRRVRQT